MGVVGHGETTLLQDDQQGLGQVLVAVFVPAFVPDLFGEVRLALRSRGIIGGSLAFVRPAFPLLVVPRWPENP
ncbi:hypothetical protein DSC45_27570 [Streptomyces sp. YIM 130001]|nr:hypothetical protein DSC45_27570 [Streptomyces sp. YIM 130001]